MSGLTEEDVAQHDLDLRFCNYGIPYEMGYPAVPMGPTLRKDCMKIFIRTFGGVEALKYFTENGK